MPLSNNQITTEPQLSALPPRSQPGPRATTGTIMHIHPDHLKAIKKFIPPADQQAFLDHAIEEALQKFSTKKANLNSLSSTANPVRSNESLGEYLEVFVDGGSRGNPGLAGGGFAVYQKSQLIMTGKEFFGIKTNNQAEYLALRVALRRIYETFGDAPLHCFMDSQLAVEQLSGRYKVKSDKIKPLYDEIVKIITQFKHFQVTHVKREQNKMADKLANEAMDEVSISDIQAPISNT